MKRALLIAAACFAFAAAAFARDYTYLDPPTLAVADFEVSMSAADKAASKQFYGQLISQALLSVLVQQNAANVVYALKDSHIVPGAPVYDPSMTFTFPKDPKAAATGDYARAAEDYKNAGIRYAAATDDYVKATNDLKAATDDLAKATGSEKDAARDRQTKAKSAQQAAQAEQQLRLEDQKQAMQEAVKAANEVAVTLQGAQELARIAGGQIARLYFPSIFKIFDKKYVENALQNGTFTVKDLYTKAAGAFNFADLDFLVLGNVYETSSGAPEDKTPAESLLPHKETASGSTRTAIGFNVRVLNTKRAEETYSYSAVVDKDLHDLPVACAQICQHIMIDILNAHCAQLTITESPDVAGAGSAGTGNAGSNGLPDLSYANGHYYLFWQPRQVEKDDNTVGDSDNSDKRKVNPDVFYWTLPGQYVISVYNRSTQQIKEIPFSINAGDVKNIVVLRDHIATPNGSITIGGIGPTTSYTFQAVPRKQSQQYWWEIFDPPMPEPSFTVTFDNGTATGVPGTTPGDTGTENSDSVHAQYRYETQDILISGVPLSAYDITATRNPPEGLSGITGIWYTSTKLTVKSKPLPVVVRDPKDVKMQIADFGLQEKQQILSPKTTKVTFILKPGFGYSGDIDVDDGSLTTDEFHWADKEKITISSEYALEDWDAHPQVTYTVWTRGYSKDNRYSSWHGYTYDFSKSQIVPEKDVIAFVDLPSLRALADQSAEEYEQRQDAERAAQLAAFTNLNNQGAFSNLPGQAASGLQARRAAAAPGAVPLFFVNADLGVGIGGYSSYSYYSGSSLTIGLALTAAAQFYWHFLPTFGLGVGGYFDTMVGASSGYALTLDVLSGDFSRSNSAFRFDIGYGSGVMLGFGVATLNAKKSGGWTWGIDAFYNMNSYGMPWDISFDFGYMFGF